jgi:hypothetical protein
VQPTFQNSVVAKKLEISKSKYFLSKTGQNQLKPTNYKKIGPLGSVGFKKKTPVLLTLAAATTPLIARSPRPRPTL